MRFLHAFFSQIVGLLFFRSAPYLSWRGRIDARHYRVVQGDLTLSYLVAGIYVLLSVLVIFLLVILHEIGLAWVSYILGGLIVFVLVVMNIYLLIQTLKIMFMRVHDFNLSAWWLLPIYIVPTVLLALENTFYLLGSLLSLLVAYFLYFEKADKDVGERFGDREMLVDFSPKAKKWFNIIAVIVFGFIVLLTALDVVNVVFLGSSLY